MAPLIRRVQSREIINVSQDSFSDPILKNTPPRSAPSPAPVNHDGEDRVEESVTDDYRAGKKSSEARHPEDLATAAGLVFRNEDSSRPRKAQKTSSRVSLLPANRSGHPVTDTHSNGDTQALGARLYSSAAERTAAPPAVEDHGEEDLYGATPERKIQFFPSRSQEGRTLRIHSSLVPASLPPAATWPGLETSSSHLFHRIPARHSAFQEAEKVDKSLAALKESFQIEPTASHNTRMASESKATPATGKLASGGGALARLRAKQQAVLGETAETPAEINEAAADTRNPPSRAVKARGKMKKSMAGPKSVTRTEPSLNPANSRPKGSAAPQHVSEFDAGRKRKAEPEAASVPGFGEANSRPSKRGKATPSDNPASPPKETQLPTASSDEYQPDGFDMPEPSPKARANKEATSRAIKPVRENASMTVRSCPRKAVIGQREAEGRQLRPRKAMHVAPVEKEQNDVSEEDKHKKAVSLDQVKEQAASNIAEDRPHDPQPDANVEQPVPVGSQFNAIVLSDHNEMSSSIGSDSPATATLPVQSERPAVHLDTPAAMRSSSPAAFQHTGPQSLRGIERSRKAQIISFDRTGARNQGSAPKSGHIRAPMPQMAVTMHRGLEANMSMDAARQKASSVAPSVNSGKSNHAAPPSNVAHDVHDALAGLSMKRPPDAAGGNGTANTVRVLKSASGGESALIKNQDTANCEEDELGYTTLNDTENCAKSPSPGQQLNAKLQKKPTASQITMPPPDGKVQLPRHAADTLEESISATSQSSSVSAVVQSNSIAGLSQNAPCASRKSNMKRSIPMEEQPVRVSKRTKAASSKDMPAGTHDAPAAERSTQRSSNQASTAVNSNNGDTIEKQSARQMKATSPSDSKVKALTASATNKAMEEPAGRIIAARLKSDTAEVFAMSKRPLHVARDFSSKVEDTLSKDVAQPARGRQKRKQMRHLSQNSQTVDINGSPVPADMEVNESSTVLETFSQQTDCSSGAIQHSSIAGLKTPIDATIAVGGDAFSVPPAHRPPCLSSNAKILPGPSGLDSKTMRHIKLTELESEKLLSKELPLYALSDPFAPLGEFRDAYVSIKHKTHLLERPVKFGRQICDPGLPSNSRASCNEDSVESSDEEPSPAPKATTTTLKQNVPPADFVNQFAADLEKQVTAFREHIAFARATEEDPDKTLVNDCSQDTEISKQLSCRLSPSSSEDSDVEVEVVEDPQPDSESSGSEEDYEDDMRKWRGCLKSHQLNLYEELVKVARVVTGYVTGMETATEIMIDDNYRRDLIMVEQEEEIQKKQYKQYVANLKKKQDEKIRQMKNLERVLQDVLDASAVAWKEHCKGRAEREHADRRIGELLAS